MNPVDIADIVVTAIVGLIGLYLAHSYRRQLKMRVEEKRLAAYAALWSKMSFTSPVRLTMWIAQPLTREEREKLFKDFTAWYYENGNGMFLGDSTRSIYLRVKDNLICDIKYYEPPSIREKLCKLPPEEQERARGYLSIRQLSLLRNRMKADLDVYGLPYHVDLDEDDKALLEFCNEDLSSKPWVSRQHTFKEDDGTVRIFPETQVAS
jgi:hypothetical protein